MPRFSSRRGRRCTTRRPCNLFDLCSGARRRPPHTGYPFRTRSWSRTLHSVFAGNRRTLGRPLGRRRRPRKRRISAWAHTSAWSRQRGTGWWFGGRASPSCAWHASLARNVRSRSRAKASDSRSPPRRRHARTRARARARARRVRSSAAQQAAAIDHQHRRGLWGSQCCTAGSARSLFGRSGDFCATRPDRRSLQCRACGAPSRLSRRRQTRDADSSAGHAFPFSIATSATPPRHDAARPEASACPKGPLSPSVPAMEAEADRAVSVVAPTPLTVADCDARY
jgi:hypothetical protein